MRGKLKWFAPLCAAMVISQGVRAQSWQATAGAQSADQGVQALAFLPNEVWIHAGDSVTWTFPTGEPHSVTFLKPGQGVRPSFTAGCPGPGPAITADGSPFDESECVNSGRIITAGKTYTVMFPKPGNYRLVCLVHVNMTGIVHVLDPKEVLPHDQDFYDRQVRAFGTTGQQVLSQLCVAVVGLGGTGSVVAQQLAHLGVGRFVLIDPDKVEATNLNRLVGAVLEDVDNTKVSVAARHIKAINSQAQCEEIVGDITYLDVVAHLPDVDFIFGCTDSMASRAVMNQLAYQYLVPCIDVGVGIYVNAGKVEYITGRAQMLSPGLACMVCTDKLDAEQIRRELMTEDERRKDQYIQGEKIPQPAVVSLNSTMSSAAVTMFLAAVTGIPSDARLLHYDGIRGSMRPAGMEPRPHCIVCSAEGALARGTSWTLPTR